MPRKRSFLQDLASCDCFRIPANYQLTDIFVFVGGMPYYNNKQLDSLISTGYAIIMFYTLS